jgi:Ser/Thr protein kinase RdoA (MazF antagonist)
MRLHAQEIATRIVAAGFVTALEDVSQPTDLYSQQNIVFRALSDGEPVIVKVYPCSAEDCWEREKTNLSRFRFHGMPVATVLKEGRVELGHGPICLLLVMTLLPGRTLTSLISHLTPKYLIRSVGTAAGRLLVQQESMERFSCAADYILAPGDRFVTLTWERLCQRYRAILLDLGFPRPLLEEVGRLVQTLADPLDYGWVTYDWRLRHLLWDEDEITGLLDLESAKPSDSLIELANFLHDVLLSAPASTRSLLCNAILSAYQGFHPLMQPNTADRLVYYLIRQALSHAAIKSIQGIRGDRVRRELRLAESYLRARDIAIIFDQS